MNIISQINNWGWEDCSLVKIDISYDNISIEISDDENRHQVFIQCDEFIGFEFIGNWDECFIERVEVSEQGKLIEKSIEKVKKCYGNNTNIPGMKKDIKGRWYQLSITLIDGVILDIACGNIKIQKN